MSSRSAASEESDGWRSDSMTLAGLLTVATRTLASELHGRLEAAGRADIRPGAGQVYETIGPRGSTVATMAARVRITPQAVVQIVDYLEALGHVERLPDPRDGRAKLVTLTADGQAASETGRATLREIEGEWEAILGPERFAAFRATLEDLVAALGERAATRRRPSASPDAPPG